MDSCLVGCYNSHMDTSKKPKLVHKKTKLSTKRAIEMAAGYRAMAEELREFAAMTAKIEHEVLPEWEWV